MDEAVKNEMVEKYQNCYDYANSIPFEELTDDPIWLKFEGTAHAKHEMRGNPPPMKITRIRIYQTHLPYVGGSYAWGAGNAIDTAIASVVVIDTNTGLTGCGEFTQRPT